MRDSAARLTPGSFRPLIARLARHRVVRFLFVGVVNTLFGYGVFFVLLRTGLAPTSALAFSTIIGVMFNFLTTGRVVFANSDITRLGRFVAVYGLIFIVNAICLEGALAIGV